MREEEWERRLDQELAGRRISTRLRNILRNEDVFLSSAHRLLSKPTAYLGKVTKAELRRLLEVPPDDKMMTDLADAGIWPI